MDIKKDVQKQFGTNAESYVNSELHKTGKDLRALINMASLTGTETVLDIATGGGHTANAFASLAQHVTALDLTSEMLKAAEGFISGNGHQNVSFIQGDAEKLPFPDSHFDIVACRIAPHHFPNAEKFVKETYRVLKKDGQFLLDDNVVPELDEFDQFYNAIEKKRDYSHFRAWKKTEWIQMLEQEGYEICEFQRFTKTFMFDSWCGRMKLPLSEQMELNDFILRASEQTKAKFRIEIKGGKVVSFQGEALILKAVKRF